MGGILIKLIEYIGRGLYSLQGVFNTKRGQVKDLNVILVEVKDDWGFNETSFQPLWDSFEKSAPDHYRFLNPGTIYGYFLTHRLEDAEELVRELTSLKKSNSIFEDLQIKLVKEERVIEFDKGGKVVEVH